MWIKHSAHHFKLSGNTTGPLNSTDAQNETPRRYVKKWNNGKKTCFAKVRNLLKRI